ncbi:hypothetical protein [Hydrogenophaga sp. 2FB]|uniref:hypothetical protein n=1 Tax=Hydrogenophaga sp. 2FB TaxID=2502187 RepID=UPI0010F8A5FF|nr:hypothetical protein [Hydrogenophaga sp. 2FB]
MPLRQFIQTVFVAACAMALLPANTAIAAECLPPACAADDSAAGGVPDGNFATDAVAAVAATPPVPAAPKIKDDDGPGSAIFSPFASVQDRAKRPPLAMLFANNTRATALAIALLIALLVTLAGVAVFSFFIRRDHP